MAHVPNPREQLLIPWHTLSAADAAARLGTDAARGLAEDEAAARLARHGANSLPEPVRRTRLATFVDQFKSVLVLLLAAAAIVTFAVGSTRDALAIFAIFVLNAFLGYAQERRAADALAELRRMAAPDARVRRAGGAAIVPAAQVVPGDLVLLEEGDRVPADVRLAQTFGFRTMEASLTGESDAVRKDADAVCAAGTPLADRRNMAWSGTTVAAGRAEGLVVATGSLAEFGRLARLVSAVEEPETPLRARLRTLGLALAIACGGVCVAVFLLGILREVPFVEMLLAAVSLAVAAVPEGLPAIVTIALALGVARMARRNVLIRRIPAVETLGATTVICTDKTGTLTTGTMTVQSVQSIDFETTLGDPRAPQPGGGTDDARARVVLRAAVAASTARLVEKDGQRAVVGDPTEGALLAAARDLGVHADAVERDEPVVASVPFDVRRKRMSITRRTASGLRSYVKGAPESVLPLCNGALTAGGVEPLGSAELDRLHAMNLALAGRGLRVLAVASRDLAAEDAAGPTAESGLVFLGLVGMRDPARPSVPGALAACRAAGIRAVMITGDQPATALAVARELAIAQDTADVMSGTELDALDDAAFAERVASVRVYARVGPEHKLRIVRAWRARGDVVAMTGDGVNDAPALKGADIGVAMGRSGTDVAKDAASMVVTDDDFASIVAAIEEGRRIFENIRKAMLYLLSGNLAEILVVAVALLAGAPLPLLPVHLLWINLVTDGLPALALATDPAEPELLSRPPRRAGTEIADRVFVRQLVASALLVAAVTLAAFAFRLHAGDTVERARTIAFSVLVFALVLKSFTARSRTRTHWELGALSNVRLLAIIAVTVAVQIWSHRSDALGHVLRTESLTWPESLATLALGLVPVTALEITKLVRRRAH